MDKYLRVAQTYAYRPRFWVFVGVYLLLAYWWFDGIHIPLLIFSSALFSSLAGAFIALHLRRQFGTAAARLAPNFAAPHLAVGLAAGLLLWLVLPAILVAVGLWEPPALALHAISGLMMALVICWPRAIILLAGLPVALAELMVWASEPKLGFARFVAQHPTGVTAGAVAVALLAQTVAVWKLLRLDEQGATVDDLSLDENVAAEPRTWQRWRLDWRDAASRRIFEAHGRGLWNVRRWRVPVVVSWQQFALPVGLVLGVLVGMVAARQSPWLAVRESWIEIAMATMFVTTSVMVVAPYGTWHARRHWLGQELLRPVTRAKYIRQLAAALAIDVALWTLLASALSLAVLFTARPAGDVHPSAADVFVVHVGLLWSMSAVLYGIALLTFGMRFWIPTIVVLAGLWGTGFWGAVITYGLRHKLEPALTDVYLFLGASAALGAILVAAAYRRWLSAEVA